MTATTDFLYLFRQNARAQSIPAQRFLFHQGDPVRDVYLLEKGLVKMMRSEPNGQEIIVELRFADNHLGVTSTLANEPAPMTAITATPCELYRLSVNEFLRLANNDRSFMHTLLALISRQRNEQISLRAQEGMLDARPRLITLLLRLAKELGIERKGKLYLALPIAKQDIAGMLGITPQSLSRILRKMKQEQLIIEEREWIILKNPQALQYKMEIGEENDPQEWLAKKGCAEI